MGPALRFFINILVHINRSRRVDSCPCFSFRRARNDGGVISIQETRRILNYAWNDIFYGKWGLLTRNLTCEVLDQSEWGVLTWVINHSYYGSPPNCMSALLILPLAMTEKVTISNTNIQHHHHLDSGSNIKAQATPATGS